MWRMSSSQALIFVAAVVADVSYITERRARGSYQLERQLSRRTHMKNHSATKPAPKELSAAELENVTGGKGAGRATFHDLSFMHMIDKASPVLMKA